MKPEKAHRYSAFALTAVYLLIALVHLFPAPNFRSYFSGTDQLHRSGTGKNTELIYNLIRTDRCRVDESKTIKIQPKTTFQATRTVQVRSYSVLSNRSVLPGNFLPDHHSDYLDYRTLRI